MAPELNCKGQKKYVTSLAILLVHSQDVLSHKLGFITIQPLTKTMVVSDSMLCHTVHPCLYKHFLNKEQNLAEEF